jgi:tetratricopeptide (TPR) repeat protein
VDLRAQLGNALLPLGDHTRMLENLQEAETLAEQLGDQARLGWILSYSAREFWLLGDAERAIGAAERTLRIAHTLGDPGLAIIAQVRLGQAHHARRDYGQAIDALNIAVGAVGDRSHVQYGMAAPPTVIARTWLAWCLVERGEVREALDRGEEGLHIAEDVDQAYTLVAACFGLALVRLRRGAFADAIGVLERALALCQVREVPVFYSWVASSLGLACVLSGEFDRSLARSSPVLDDVGVE